MADESLEDLLFGESPKPSKQHKVKDESDEKPQKIKVDVMGEIAALKQQLAELMANQNKTPEFIRDTLKAMVREDWKRYQSKYQCESGKLLQLKQLNTYFELGLILEFTPKVKLNVKN
jgi:hypothetical protein